MRKEVANQNVNDVFVALFNSAEQCKIMIQCAQEPRTQVQKEPNRIASLEIIQSMM